MIRRRRLGRDNPRRLRWGRTTFGSRERGAAAGSRTLTAWLNETAPLGERGGKTREEGHCEQALRPTWRVAHPGRVNAYTNPHRIQEKIQIELGLFSMTLSWVTPELGEV